MSGHVRLGGSKAHRFLVCLASPRLEQEAGEQPEKEAALDGTTAHHVGERCIRLHCDPHHPSFLGQTILGRVVTQEMADAVQVYVDWARDVMQGATYTFLEQEVTLAALKPPEEMKGSADLITIHKSLRRMIVGDFKHGIGYVVEVKGNKQLRYYALAALLSLPHEAVRGIDTVQMTIIQPRAFHPDGPIRSETITIGELMDFAEDILAAAHAIQDPDAPVVPGDHCQFCNAAANCKGRADYSVTQAQTEFEVIERDVRPLHVIPLEELGVLAATADDIIERMKAWVKDAKERIEQHIRDGQDVPGWKMVPKRATRVWNNSGEVKTWAQLDMGLEEAQIHTEPELISPAQMEALVGKKNLPKGLYSSVSSGYNLVRATSAKDAARLSAGDEFEAVEL